MKRHSQKMLGIITIFSFLFFTAIAFDLSPYLRGPFDPIFDSQWPYYFVSTWERLYAPLVPFLLFVLLFLYFDKQKKLSRRKELLLLLLVCFSVFFIQIGLVHFSRFEITILFRRLADPGINGYFSTALRVESIPHFLSDFHLNQPTFDQHARGHFPGGVLFIRLFLDLFDLLLSPFQEKLSFLNTIRVGWAAHLWNTLTITQKAASLTLPFLLHLLTSLVIIPFYYFSKAVTKDRSVAIRSTFLFGLVPSFTFFALVLNPLYAAFPIVSAYFLSLAFQKKQSFYIFLSGLVFGIGLFFTLSILPVLVGYFLLILLHLKRITHPIQNVLHFIWGIFTVLFCVSLLGFEPVKSFFVIIKGQAERHYFSWLLFNPYDFFVFLGVPVFLLFLISSIYFVKHGPDLYKKITLSFWITFILLVVSGVSLGEVGRIWFPFMFVPVLLAAIYSTMRLKLSSGYFLLLLILLFIQLVILEEFWVPIW